MIEVKTAGQNDIRTLTEILVTSWRSAFQNIMSIETLEKYTDMDICEKNLQEVHESGRGVFYIALLDGKPCAELYWCAGEEIDDSAEIVALHSLPEFWGRGAAQALMEKTLSEIARLGVKCCYLWVFTENARARKFYEKCGFKIDGKTQISQFDDAQESRYVRCY